MSSPQLLPFPEATALATAAAGDWVALVEAANHRAAHLLVALSGGRIAKPFFSAVVEAAQARHVSFASVQFFWADERLVPPDDPESSFAVAREFLFTPLRIGDEAIHRIRGEVAGERAAAQAAAELCRVAPRNGAGQPVLDLVFLGMGEDGHVASLFPGEPAERAAAAAVYRAITGPKPPPRRVTLGYAALAAAERVWVLISGPGKEAALRESLRPTGRTPLAKVLRSRALTRVYTDVPVA